MLQPSVKLLVVVRDELLLLLRHVLESEGYKTVAATTIRDAHEVIGLEEIDVVILDESFLSDAGDPTVCHCELIRRWDAPLLILGADCRAASHVLHMLPGQAIDLIRKPISPQALLRRVGIASRGEAAATRFALAFGGVELNARTQRIYRNGRRVEVTPLEFRLLHHLIKSPGEVFSREDILRAAWPSDVFVEPRTVDVHMGKLRKSLNEHGEPNLIRTVRSRGYSLDLAEEA